MSTPNENIYARWLSGELSPDELESLRASGELKELQVIIDDTDRIDVHVRVDYEKSLEAIRTKQLRPVRKLQKRMWMSIAASVTMILGLGYWYLLSDLVTLSAAHGDIVAVDLPENSKVYLNDGSQVSYKKRSFADKREVSLTGEALFEVEPGNSFMVHTANGTVEVLGTTFNVRSWDNDFEVTCFEGKVRVIISTKQTILTTQQYVSKRENLEVRPIDHEQPFWQQGLTRFDNEPLSGVIQELERQFDIKVNFPAIERQFTGAFSHDDLDKALREICIPLGITYTIDTTNGVVSLK